MMGNVIVAGILASVVLTLFLFARFLAWKDNREMDEADHEIHHVQQGVMNTPYNSVKW